MPFDYAMQVTLTRDNFQTEVLSSPIPVLVDFWAEWCAPCKIIAPAVAEIAETYAGKLKVGKLNVDDFGDVAQTYQVRGIPNLKIFKNGKIVEEIVGAVPKAELVKRVEKQIQ